MKKLSFSLIACGLAFFQAFGQLQPVKSGWMEPIDRLFDGIASGDSALVRSAFVANATLVTVGRDGQGNPIMTPTPLPAFLTAVGTHHPDAWSEPIWNISAHQSANFVQVWAEYAFYVGKRFSHCGADAFQLVQDKDGHWKIFHLVDTRQKEGCAIPETISSRFR